jgi:hypothetical protein
MQVCSLIMATKMCNEPSIPYPGRRSFRDADMSHFAKKELLGNHRFFKRGAQGIGELPTIPPKKWRDKNIKMFRTKHQFYHGLRQGELGRGKADRILKQLLKEKKAEKKIAKKEALKAKYKSESP